MNQYACSIWHIGVHCIIYSYNLFGCQYKIPLLKISDVRLSVGFRYFTSLFAFKGELDVVIVDQKNPPTPYLNFR